MTGNILIDMMFFAAMYILFAPLIEAFFKWFDSLWPDWM